MQENKVMGTICNEQAVQAFVAQSERDNIPLVVINDEIDFSTDVLSMIKHHQTHNLDLMVVVAEHVALNKSMAPELLNVRWV